MALILNIETSTTLCSVALALDGKVIAVKETDEGYTHAENLHVFIESVLKAAKVSPTALNAIAVGSGPGSYTGLRIGVSGAKGLAYALKLPLIAVNTLQVMANAAVKESNHESPLQLYCPMLDARRMEVYCAIMDHELKFTKETSAQIISEENLAYFKTDKPICFFGDGMPKCKEVLGKLPNVKFLENIKPSATSLAELAFSKFKKQQFEDVAYFEPFYLKDFLIR